MRGYTERLGLAAGRSWPPYPTLTTGEALFAIFFASLSGAAILVHTFGPVPLSFTVPFIVFPSSCLLVGAILIRRQLPERLHAFSSGLMRGAVWGLVATLFYDAVRPLITHALGLTFNPYRAMPIFGQLITGLSANDPLTLAAGWTYHFWNGITFGMMFALVRPRGGVIAGLIWAETLQALMMITYPSFLQARLDDPGFLATGLIGHGIWGIVLGTALKKTSPKA